MGTDRSAQQWLQAGRPARLTLAALALALLWTLVPSASAATPSHQRAPALDVEGLNHACGVAVDSKGDLYASSAGAAKVLVFSPTDHETPIGEISNAKEPCGLALTSTGNLYVSEAKTGEVVRYKPTVYPFSGAPSYGPREVIDASGQAKGISVDPFDNRLYVAEGTRISAYDAEGELGVNETQDVRCPSCTGGSYTLIFKGEETKPIPFEGPASEVQAALEELASIGPGEISVKNEGGNDGAHFITFEGKYGHTDVEALQCKDVSLEGSGHECKISEKTKSWDGRIAEGELEDATGIAAYAYKANNANATFHLAVADAAEDQIKLFSSNGQKEAAFRTQKLRRTLDGPKEGEEFGFGSQGAYLATDSGSCPPKGQACSAGHFLLYDDAHEALEEFEADGELVSQTPFAAGDGAPTAIAIDRSGAANTGTLYATTGAGASARTLAFGALGAPSRSGPLKEKEQSLTLAKACSVAIDDFGNRYVAVGFEIFVYPPTGSKTLAKFSTGEKSCRIAVDSEGNVYVLLKEKVAYFKPSSFPPKEGTTYGAAVTVAKESEFGTEINALAIDPASDRLLATSAGKTIEYGSAAEGSKPVGEIAAGLDLDVREAVATCDRSGNLYVAGGGRVFVLDPTGKEILTQISGTGSPLGTLSPHVRGLAVDQADCHLLAFDPGYKALEEFDDSGAYVGSYGSFTTLVTLSYTVAVDNGASSPNKGDVFLAYDDTAKETPDLWAFGGLGYPLLEEHELTVKKTGGGSGIVTSKPAGIDCGKACSAPYKKGTGVVLSTTPDPENVFKGWSGCEAQFEGEPGEALCEVTMQGATEVTATFVKEEVEEPGIPLTVSLEGTGSGTVTSDVGLISCEPFCSDEYAEGTKVTLTASPTAGSLFMAWKHCDTGAVNGRQCTVTMDKAKEVQAVFVTAHLLTVAKAPGSGPGKVSSYGGITCLYGCTEVSALIKEGTAVLVKQTPAKHFHFAGWGGDCSGTGACELTMGEDHDVTADFEEDARFSLSLSKAGGGQALIKTKPAGILCGFTCTEAVASFYGGESITVSWKLNKGTTKLTWSKGAGTCTGTFEALEGSCTVTIDAPKSLLASLE
jgi:hypothetical protein